jgi:hypothetical protein
MRVQRLQCECRTEECFELDLVVRTDQEALKVLKLCEDCRCVGGHGRHHCGRILMFRIGIRSGWCFVVLKLCKNEQLILVNYLVPVLVFVNHVLSRHFQSTQSVPMKFRWITNLHLSN